MGRKVLAWSATEVVGMSITNPRPVVKVPITPEMREKWEKEAAEKGLSLDEYLDILFAEAEEATNGRENSTG